MKEREKERLCERLEMEASKILDKSEMTTGGLDSLFKIIDIMKDIENMKYWDKKCEYYDAVLDEMQSGGYSERGYSRDGGYSERRDSQGRYSRNDGRMPEYDRGSSYANRGQHWVRGHYSRAEGPDSYQRYMGEKQSYRSEGKSEDCKHRMLEALEDHLEMLTKEISDMGADADCREERETIKRYMEKLRNMM